VARDQDKAEEHLGFDFETEKLGRVYCRLLNFKLLFRFTALTKSAPDTVPDFLWALLSVVGERRDDAAPEDRAISWDQAKALTDQELEQFAANTSKPPIGSDQAGGHNRQLKALTNARIVNG
jgi:hypothetical protein